MLINLPQQKASPSHYLIPGSTTISRVEALCFFLIVAGGEREENCEGGAMLPLQSFIFVLLLSLIFASKQKGNTEKPIDRPRGRGQGTGESTEREGVREQGNQPWPLRVCFL